MNKTAWHKFVIAVVGLVSIVMVALPSTTTTAKASIPAPSSPLVKGTSGVPVTQVQYILKSMGYTVAVTGSYDQRTVKAITHWQKVNHIFNRACQCYDGVVGPVTWASLTEYAPNAPAVAPKKVPAAPRAPTAPVAAPVAPQAPAEVVAAPPASVDTNVEQIIRDVWPADLADWAVRIATRESRLVPTARNACCYGLFQIHWGAHHVWLAADYGITSPSQLLDARTNATVALALYQATGPGPWTL